MVPRGPLGGFSKIRALTAWIAPTELCLFQERKFSPKTEVFGQTSLRTSGQRLRSGPPNPGKKQAFWHRHAARTSTKKRRSEKLRADFSYPTVVPSERSSGEIFGQPISKDWRKVRQTCGEFFGRFSSCGVFQWNPKYGCKGTVTTRFALIALVAWQYSLDSTLRKLFVHPKYG